MSKVLIFLFALLIFSKNSSAQSQVITCTPCIQFDSLNSLIRDGLISKKKARLLFSSTIKKVKSFYLNNKFPMYDSAKNCFPIAGYTHKSIGGINGNGYIGRGYDYFAGNKHTAHPAQDIFVNDADQNILDDITNAPISVLSMTGGVVVATYTNWDSLSILRGGNYIYVYDPSANQLIYYAHNAELFVKTGDVVKPGEKIANIGRSGLSAFKKRSPTHLHIMGLLLGSNFMPQAFNLFKNLKNSGNCR